MRRRADEGQIVGPVRNKGAYDQSSRPANGFGGRIFAALVLAATLSALLPAPSLPRGSRPLTGSLTGKLAGYLRDEA